MKCLFFFVVSILLSGCGGGSTGESDLDSDSSSEIAVYLLVGQSNMVGTSELGAKQAGVGQVDEPHPRIFQLNVPENEGLVEPQSSVFLDEDSNSLTPLFIPAEDPLHAPLESGNSFKSGTTIGLGLSFAKAALADSSGHVYLVPAAFEGTGFCISPFDVDYAWNATATTNPNLGGTGLADRALTRLNLTLRETGGVFRGILWHQGEADSVSPECAAVYAENISALVARIRSEARIDALGPDARGENASIPFIVGSMSKGNDDRGDFSVFGTDKTVVDTVHRNISQLIPHSDWVNNDDLVPPAYPCGSDSCVHFGALAYREMGVRYYNALVRVNQR